MARDLAAMFGVDAPVPLPRRPLGRSAQPLRPVPVEAALQALPAAEARWERLPRNHGGRRSESFATVLDPGAATSGLRLSYPACREAFGSPQAACQVHLEVNRGARRVAVVLDPDGDYRLYVGHIGGGSVSRALVAIGLSPGRYRIRATAGRVEFSADGRMP